MNTELVTKISRRWPIYSISALQHAPVNLEEVKEIFKSATSAIKLAPVYGITFEFENKSVTLRIIQTIQLLGKITYIRTVPSKIDYDLKEVAKVLDDKKVCPGVTISDNEKYVLWVAFRLGATIN
jgi:hypothetical protein